MIDWYRLESKRARGLILILVMAKYPASITAGKMAELSMSSFCGVGILFLPQLFTIIYYTCNFVHLIDHFVEGPEDRTYVPEFTANDRNLDQARYMETCTVIKKF